jgi:NitT/TauT family transport system substrate-binding protein
MITRREFLKTATLAGPASVLGTHPRAAGAEPPPETTIRLVQQIGTTCSAPQYVAEDLLHSEGFTDVRYVPVQRGPGVYEVLASGEVQINMTFGPPVIIRIEAGEPIVFLAGVHIGCLELFGTDQIRTLRDLKGKKVATAGRGSAPHVFLASMVAYVGLDPNNDITWVAHSAAESKRLLAEGKIDAFLTAPPFSFELRAEKIGHVVVNMTTDRPWSQYFCCMLSGNRDYVRKQPVATKRAVRAILKASDLCAPEPDRVARLMVDKGYTKNYDHAFQTLKELPYNAWRTHDPGDTVRFFSLRLHEAGMIKSSPQKILAQGTDWRFLNELKKELKG